MMPAKPIHASHVMRPRVWMLPQANPTRQATATKTAVQAPWDEREFRPMEMLSMPEPEQQIQSTQGQKPSLCTPTLMYSQSANAIAKTSRPIRPNSSPPTSSML